MQILREIFAVVLDYSILFFDCVGVLVVVSAGIVGVIDHIRHKPRMRLKLARGLALGLEFKLGSEILHTVMMRELREILIVGLIILLRSALAVIIHWEIKIEEKQ